MVGKTLNALHPEYTGPPCRFQFVGKQTIARAEAFAILTATKIADKNADLLVLTDSQSTCTLIEKLTKWRDNHTPKNMTRHMIENYSIIAAITDQIEIRATQGRTTTIKWVKAHVEEKDRTPDHEMNSLADDHTN